MTKFIPKNYPNGSKPKPVKRIVKKETTQKKRIEGALAKRNGEYFENLIESTCTYYRMRNIADIQKTPEPMRVLSVLDKNKGIFKAVFTKQAQPDFKGVLKGGKTVIFEAKHTNGKSISRNRLSEEQVANFKSHHKLGAECFVLISFEMKRFYKIPWNVWDDMEFFYKKKSVNESDIKGYEVFMANGYIDLLEAVK